jgi:hypothetical protein
MTRFYIGLFALGALWIGGRYGLMLDFGLEPLKAFCEIIDLISIGAVILPIEQVLEAVTEKIRVADRKDVREAYTAAANGLTWPMVISVVLCVLGATILAHDKGMHVRHYKEWVIVLSVAAVGLWGFWLWVILTLDMVVTAILCPVGSFSLLMAAIIVSIVFAYETVDFTYLNIPVRIHAEMWKRVAESLIFVFLLDVAKTWRDREDEESPNKPKTHTLWSRLSLKEGRAKKVINILTKEAWPFWLLIGGLCGSWGIAFLAASQLTEQVLYAGTFLQFIGLGTVAFGINDLRKSFGKPSLKARISTWVQHLLTAILEPTPVSGTIVAANMTGKATISGAALTETSGLSLDQRVDALEKALTAYKKEQAERLAEIRNNIGRVEAQVENEGNARKESDNRLLEKIEDVAVGGIRMEAIGLVWLVLGMLGTSIPKVIAGIMPT